MSTRRIASRAFIVLLASQSMPALAYNEEGHYLVLFAVARFCNFTANQAALLASASWSVDNNEPTTAFSFQKVKTEGLAVVRGASRGNGDPSLADLPHMVSGQVFHALTSPENRQLVEAAHIRRIQRALSQARSSGDPRQYDLAVLYLGIYLHFVADEVVHPYTPLFGHAPSAAPDQTDTDAFKLRIMTHLMRDKLEQFRAGRLQVTPRREVEFLPQRAHSHSERELERIARAVETGWQPDYQGAVAKAWDRIKGRRLDALDVWHINDEERAANAAHRVRQALAAISQDYELVPFRNITLDVNGNPAATAANLHRFGAAGSLEELPFTSVLAQTPELRGERQAALVPAAILGHTRSKRGGDQREASGPPEARRWALPASPGGVALDPGLKLPPGLGRIEGITLDDSGVVLATSAERYRFDLLDPYSLATAIRTVAAGQIPYVTIGSQPSDRPGYARVTYCPALRGTREGAMLYEADVQFKAIFADFPAGEHYPVTALASGFPGLGGDSTRLWITSSGIELANDHGLLRTVRHGMRILGETTVRGAPRPDPELDSYTRKLTDDWDRIAAEVWPFRAVQSLALATAVAFWIRDRRVPVDPVLMTLPQRFQHTPDYARIVAAVGRTASITGGVALTPEEKHLAPGRMFLFQVSSWIDGWEQGSETAWIGRSLLGAAALLLIAVLVCVLAAVLRLLVAQALASAGKLTAFVVLGSFLVLAQGLLVVTVQPLMSGDWLSTFDKGFLACLVTVAAFPVLLLLWAKWVGDSIARHFPSRAAVVVFSLLGPICTGSIGVAAAILSVAAMGPVPSSRLERLLTLELAPMNTLLDATLTAAEDREAPSRIRILPVPRSLAEVFTPPFESRSRMPSGAEEIIRPVGRRDPLLPVDKLLRIDRPPFARGDTQTAHYSVDGEPPF